MSNDHATAHHHDAPHDPHQHGTSTLRGYLTGFGLSVILTAIPFWLVMGNVLGSAQTTMLLVMAFAAVQMIVHMIYFLHMDTKSEGGWTMMALIFTAILVFITLTGSLWVMYHLNANMMPMSAQDASQMP
ncbi:MAG: cytochrome o ubiquinol oxidase subunit IV [Micavibrio sp.]|nr:cytochrome o ubiquinol oxidase subunit IV [Micavibrio sp.]